MTRLVLASGNRGKVSELAAILADFAVEVVAQTELGVVPVEETGTTFTENALLKARAAAQAAGSVALADDSGLCVTALGGDPGIYSARWAGPDKDFPAAMRRIHDALGLTMDRSASFICVLALVWPDGATETLEGRVDGTLIWPPRGTYGHGYDPMFVPQGEPRSFAEMTEDEKNALSHRGKALKLLLEQLGA